MNNIQTDIVNLRGGGCGQGKATYQQPAAKTAAKDLPSRLLSMTDEKVKELKSRILTIGDKSVQDEFLNTINWLDINEYWYQQITDDKSKMTQCIKLLQFILLDVLEIVEQIIEGSRFIAYSFIRVANSFSRIMVVYYTLNKEFIDLELSNNLKEKINSIQEKVKSIGEQALYYNGLQYECGITEACINICPVDDPEGRELGLALLTEIVKSAVAMSPSDDLFSSLGNFAVYGVKALYQKYKESNFKEMMTKCLFIEQMKWSIVKCVEKQTFQINSIFKTLARFYINEVQSSSSWQVKYCWIKANHWIMAYRVIITPEQGTSQQELITQQVIQLIDKSERSFGAVVNESACNQDLSGHNNLYVDVILRLRSINRIKNKILYGNDNLPQILAYQEAFSNNNDQQNEINQKIIQVQNQLENLNIGTILDQFQQIQDTLTNIFTNLTDLSELLNDYSFQKNDQFLLEDICEQSKFIPKSLQELQTKIISLKITLIQFGCVSENFINILNQDDQIKQIQTDLNEHIDLQTSVAQIQAVITEYRSSKSNNEQQNIQYQEAIQKYIKTIHSKIEGQQMKDSSIKDKLLPKLISLMESIKNDKNITQQLNDIQKISSEATIKMSKYQKQLNLIELIVCLQKAKIAFENVSSHLEEVYNLNILYSKLSFVPLQYIQQEQPEVSIIQYIPLLNIKIEAHSSLYQFQYINQLFQKIIMNKSSLEQLHSYLNEDQIQLLPGFIQSQQIIEQVIKLKWKQLDLLKLDPQKNKLELQLNQPLQQMQGISEVQSNFIQQYEIIVQQFQNLIQNVLSLDQEKQDQNQQSSLQNLKQTLAQTQHKIQSIQDYQIKFFKQYRDSLRSFKDLFENLLNQDQGYLYQFWKLNNKLQLKSWNIKLMNQEFYEQIIQPNGQKGQSIIEADFNQEEFIKDIKTIIKLIISNLDEQNIKTIQNIITADLLDNLLRCTLSDQIIKELTSKFNAFNNTDSKDQIQIHILSTKIIENLKLITENQGQGLNVNQVNLSANEANVQKKVTQVIDTNFIDRLSSYKQNFQLYSNSLKQILNYNKTDNQKKEQTLASMQFENAEYLIDLINNNFNQISNLQFMNQLQNSTLIDQLLNAIQNKLNINESITQQQLKQCLELGQISNLTLQSTKQKDNDQWRYRECQLFNIIITQQKLVNQYSQEYAKQLIIFKALETDTRIQKIFKSQDFIIQQQNALEKYWKEQSSSIQSQISDQLNKLSQLQKQIQSQQPGEDRDQLLRDHSALEAQINDQIQNVSSIGNSLGITIAFIQDLKQELLVIQDQLKELTTKLNDMSLDIKFLIGKSPQQLLEIRMERILKQKTIDDARSVYVQLYTVEMINFDNNKESEKRTPLFNSHDEYDGEIDEFIRSDKQRSLLVHGPAGSGKSTAAKKVEEHLWIKYKSQSVKNWNDAKEKPIIPIFIQLPTLKDPKFKALQETLKSSAYLFNDKQIADLQKFVQDGKIRLFIIMDSYDELNRYYIEQQLNVTNKFEQWCDGENYQILNTTRSEILTNKVEYRSWFASSTKKITNSNFKEIRILPFEAEQRNNFYTQYCKLSLKQAIIDIYDILFDYKANKIDTALIINDLWEEINPIVNNTNSNDEKLLDITQINSIIQLIKQQKNYKIDLYKDQEAHLRQQLAQLWSFNMYVQNIDRLKIIHLVETPYMTNIVVQVLPQLIELYSSQDHLKIVFIRNLEVKQKQSVIFKLIDLKAYEVWDLLLESKALIEYKITDNQMQENIISSILRQINSLIPKNIHEIVEKQQQEFYMTLKKFIQDYFETKLYKFNKHVFTTMITKYQDQIQDQQMKSLIQILLSNEIIIQCIEQNQPTSYDFYQMFLQEYVKKQINKLAYKQQNLQISKFTQDTHDYVQKLGTLMTQNQLTSIEYHQKGIIDKKSEGQLEEQIFLLFDDNAKFSNIKAQIRTSIPLKIRSDSYSFFHKSIQEYLFARSFIDFLETMKPLQELKIYELFAYRKNRKYEDWDYSKVSAYDNYRKLIVKPELKVKLEQVNQLINLLGHLDEHLINQRIYSEDFFIGSINFIANKIKQNPDLGQIVMILLKISKLGKNFSNCSSNCFHIFERTKQCLVGEDLSGVHLSRISIRNANLKSVNLQYSQFSKVGIDGTNLAGANLAYCKWQKLITNELPWCNVGARLFSIAYSRDGTRIVTGSGDKKVKIWDSKTGKQIHELNGHTGVVRTVDYSSDGRQVISGSNDSTVRIWDSQNGKQIGDPLTGHTGAVNCVMYSSDGKMIASASGDKTIRIWDSFNRKLIGASLTGHTSEVCAIMFSPNGDFIASGSSDQTVRIWDCKSGTQIGEPLTGHTDDVKCISYSPCGKFIISGSDDHSIIVWDSLTGKQIGDSLTGHTRCVRSICYSPDGKLILSGSSDKTIRLWDAQTGKQIGDSLLGHQDAVWSVAFSPQGKLIASGSEDQTVRIWDSQSGRQVRDTVKESNSIHAVQFSPDGKIIAAADSDRTIKLWDSESGNRVMEFIGHRDTVTTVSFSPDGRYIVSGSDDETARVWDTQTGKQILRFNDHKRVILSVQYSPDGKFILSAGRDESFRIWDIETGKQICQGINKYAGVMNQAIYSPDGKFIATANLDKTVGIWKSQSAEHVVFLKGHNDYVTTISYSPDGKYLASGSADATIRIWEITNNKEIAICKGHTKKVSSVCYSPNGKFIASGSPDYTDYTIRIWNSLTGQLIGKKLSGHTDMVYSVQYSPDGRFIVSGSKDGSIRLWEAQSAIEIGYDINQEINQQIRDESKTNKLLQQPKDSCILRIPNQGHILYHGCRVQESQIQSRLGIDVLQLWIDRQNQ